MKNHILVVVFKIYNELSSQLSLLNASSNSRSKDFNLKYIEVLVGMKDISWFERTHVSMFLAIDDNRTSLNSLEKLKMLTRQKFEPSRRATLGYSGLKNQENKPDKFLSVYSIIYTIMNSRKNKRKALTEHIIKDIVPRGFNAKLARNLKKLPKGN